jgi:small subunit ribosomal protein S18
MALKKSKVSPISFNQKIDYKDIDLLTLFVTEQGIVLPRRATGVTVQQQRKLSKAIKRARVLSARFLSLHLMLFKKSESY